KGVTAALDFDPPCPGSAAVTKRDSPNAGEQATPRSKVRRDQFPGLPINSALGPLHILTLQTLRYFPRSALSALQRAGNGRGLIFCIRRLAGKKQRVFQRCRQRV